MTLAQQTTTCPSWCTVEHTRGDQFHRSAEVVAEGFGRTLRANRVQAIGKGFEVRVVVAGIAMTPDKARQFGREFVLLASSEVQAELDARPAV